MAWPRCPACKRRAIEAGADPKTTEAPEMVWLDGSVDLSPAEDRYFRLWECACGHRLLTVEIPVGPPESCYPKRALRSGSRMIVNKERKEKRT